MNYVFSAFKLIEFIFDMCKLNKFLQRQLHSLCFVSVEVYQMSNHENSVFSVTGRCDFVVTVCQDLVNKSMIYKSEGPGLIHDREMKISKICLSFK